MTEQSDRCSFLNEEGRCSIHDARPGFCRMFPLGRLYEDGTFSYFLQVNECPKENKTKVKVRRWLDTPELGKYEAFTTKWHYYLKEKQNAARESEDDAFRQQISMNILKLFYLLPYDGNTDFYTQFADRTKRKHYKIYILWKFFFVRQPSCFFISFRRKTFLLRRRPGRLPGSHASVDGCRK